MSLLQNVTRKIFGKEINKQITLAVAKELVKKGKALNWTPKTIYRTRIDIGNWNEGQLMYNNADEPKTYGIQLLYNEIGLDALLTSQIENRKQQVFSAEFVLKNASGEVDEEQTLMLKKSIAYRKITDAMLEARPYGYSLIEIDVTKDKQVIVQLLPRTNVVPKSGLWYPDFTGIETIKYREMPEYGKWILEFDSGDIGLLNKAIPHVLFKRFAQSCWSELCEIYGIPPRVMKTNTQDPTMLSRAEQMMKDMGAASWFIIDETEAFEFAKGADTDGDVYSNLITLCNNENSLLISGAIIGQDTKNGNRSKDESAQNVLWELVKSDMELCEQWWNGVVIPAYVKIGAMPAGLTFEFSPTEDLKQLFEFTKGFMQYKNVDDEWIKEKFGVQVTGDRANAGPAPDEGKDKSNLSAFFD